MYRNIIYVWYDLTQKTARREERRMESPRSNIGRIHSVLIGAEGLDQLNTQFEYCLFQIKPWVDHRVVRFKGMERVRVEFRLVVVPRPSSSPFEFHGAWAVAESVIIRA
ncbi:hypothetical protein Zmor_001526 [Zophobas morio]|uniref:Uncharacterized protein n=1 Tax=Zophobas morio TaxID=2755281 RepID=A0AA38J5E1_9CUCU|nr:hypothetical protein Zmor_001526 [Zophobas morio]